MLTAAGEVADRVAGLALGADDYLPKPFAFDELVRGSAALGRRARPARRRCCSAAGLPLDTAPPRASPATAAYVPLTRKEFAVLESCWRADGAVVSAEELLERAWDEHADPFTTSSGSRSLELRRKLGEPPLIETVVGAGYRL